MEHYCREVRQCSPRPNDSWVFQFRTLWHWRQASWLRIETGRLLLCTMQLALLTISLSQAHPFSFIHSMPLMTWEHRLYAAASSLHILLRWGLKCCLFSHYLYPFSLLPVDRKPAVGTLSDSLAGWFIFLHCSIIGRECKEHHMRSSFCWPVFLPQCLAFFGARCKLTGSQAYEAWQWTTFHLLWNLLNFLWIWWTSGTKRTG